MLLKMIKKISNSLKLKLIYIKGLFKNIILLISLMAIRLYFLIIFNVNIILLCISVLYPLLLNLGYFFFVVVELFFSIYPSYLLNNLYSDVYIIESSKEALDPFLNNYNNYFNEENNGGNNPPQEPNRQPRPRRIRVRGINLDFLRTFQQMDRSIPAEPRAVRPDLHMHPYYMDLLMAAVTQHNIHPARMYEFDVDPLTVFRANNGILGPDRIGGEPILNDTPFGIALLNEYISSLQADNIPFEDSQRYMHVYMHQAFDIVNNNSIYLPDRPVVRQEIFWSLYGTLKLEYQNQISR